MSAITWAALRQTLAAQYDSLLRRLSRRLGSEGLARESLNEAYLHLDRADEPPPIHAPEAYLLRVAYNLAIGQHRAGARLEPAEATERLVEDPAAGPADTAEARELIDALERALARMPERRRAILIAARLHGEERRQIARRLGISRRLVQLELERAIAFLIEALGRDA